MTDIHMFAEVRVDLPAQSLKEACKRVIQRFQSVNFDTILLPIELKEYLKILSPDHKWVCVPEEEVQRAMKNKGTDAYNVFDNYFELRVFEVRDYDLFGWLADVRNHSRVPVLGCEKGVPLDPSDFITMEAEEWYEKRTS